MPAAINLKGQKFGRLTVLAKQSVTRDGGIKWFCLCDCGKTVSVKSGNLRSGHTLSCGCLKKERISETQATHQQSHRRLYNVWTSMKQRCYNPKSTYYKDYGGRGIVMCDEWRESYSTFHKWAMENGYDPDAPYGKCTIDRVDVDGPYAPWNCRWTDMKTQRHNRRDCKK